MISHLSKSKGEQSLNPDGVYMSIEMPYKDKAAVLNFCKTLIEDGKLRSSIIDRNYPLGQVVEAHGYVEASHKKGNIAITVQ